MKLGKIDIFMLFTGILICMLWSGSFFALQFIPIAIAILAIFIFRPTQIRLSCDAILLFGIAIIMLFSLLIFSVNKHIGVLEWTRYLLLPLSVVFFSNHKDKGIVAKAIYCGCLIIAALGLLSYMSIVEIPFSMLEASWRLQSVIQYANTTALIMVIGIIYSINYWRDSRKIYHVLAAGILIYALVLTGSRTSFIIFLFVAVLYVFMLLPRKYGFAVLAILLVAVGIFSALNFRIVRISIFEPTLIERFITYQDALTILKSRFVQGFGIGNWQEQQYLYQSAPYTARFIHSFYLQLFLDGGAVSVILFLAVTLPALVRGWKKKSIHFFILLTIMLHIIIDFHMTFACVILITMFSVSELQSEKYFTINPRCFRHAAWIPIVILISIWGSEWFYSQSNKLLLDNHLEEAMAASSRSVMLNPMNNNAYFNMSQSTRDVSLTESYLHKAIALNEFDTDSTETLVMVHLYYNQYSEAVELSQRLFEIQRFNQSYQNLYRLVLSQALTDGVISHEEMSEKVHAMNAQLETVNPLYTQYIQPVINNH